MASFYKLMWSNKEGHRAGQVKELDPLTRSAEATDFKEAGIYPPFLLPAVGFWKVGLEPTHVLRPICRSHHSR
ncbi:unnamed protein product [Danaus chrysippus]|uniref:(African queen) hypothetical protein n=1 Tax=Danaus chrysippus TaxID=151541 RepID=A0A8J2VW26_9NEOP|nr:unnamed protein product [Danaus chrysippus]